MKRTALLALSLVCSSALAQTAEPSNLTGTTLCISAKNTVGLNVEGAGKMNLRTLADKVYAEIKNVLKAQGVKYQEAEGCNKSAAAFYLIFDVTKETESGARAYVASATVSDWTNPKYKTYVDIWTAAQFGVTGGEDDEVTTGMFEDAQDVIGDFAAQWKAANR